MRQYCGLRCSVLFSFALLAGACCTAATATAADIPPHLRSRQIPSGYLTANFGFAQDYMWRNPEIARVLGHRGQGPRTVFGSRVNYGQKFGSHWMFAASADLFLDYRRGGGQVLGEQSYAKLQAFDSDFEPKQINEELYLLAQIGKVNLLYQFKSAYFRFGRLEMRQKPNFKTWNLAGITQIRLPLHRAAQHAAFQDGAEFSFRPWENILGTVRTAYDHRRGWGAELFNLTYFTFDTASIAPIRLITESRLGWFDHVSSFVFDASYFLDSLSSISTTIRLEDHEAAADIGRYFELEYASHRLGPGLHLKYIYNSAGAVDRSAYNLAAVLAGRLPFLDRHYASFGAEIDVRAGLNASAFTTLNLRDFSQFLELNLRQTIDGARAGVSLAARLTLAETLDDAWYYADWVGISLDWQFGEISPLLGAYL